MGDAGMTNMNQADFSFGDQDLQRLSVFNPLNNDTSSHKGLWIIYIHGGAWRDPTITQTSFLPTITHLLSHPLRSQITAFASLSYRLSLHPDHPQGPETPASELRDAKHPDHLLDVLNGIWFLREKYRFGSNYILIGHSCGATLALQALMRSSLLSSSPRFENPIAIIGVAGIYNLRALRDANPHPAYQSFLSGAFGEDEKVWDEVSPARYQGFGEWKEGKLIVLASSTGDELVDEGQINEMDGGLRGLEKGEEGGLRVQTWKDMLGMGHDEIWENGEGLAKVIGGALEILSEEKKA